MSAPDAPEPALIAESVAYGSHHADEVVEAYEAAVARLRRNSPMAAARVERYVEEFLGTHSDGSDNAD